METAKKFTIVLVTAPDLKTAHFGQSHVAGALNRPFFIFRKFFFVSV
jgi:hypothetical protein